MSPSAWRHRLAVAVLAACGCGIATYLSLYQLHLLASVPDPLFGSASSEAVLTSALSRALPVPDATLGALGYLVEVVLTLVGGAERWRTQPRIVLAYGVVLVGLALTSAVLIVVQIVLVRALCSLCLASAAISFCTAALGAPEVLAGRSHSFHKENRYAS